MVFLLIERLRFYLLFKPACGRRAVPLFLKFGRRITKPTNHVMR